MTRGSFPPRPSIFKIMSNQSKPTCENCKHHNQGVLHSYIWQECTKNWSDKLHGSFYGVVKNTCANYQPKQNK